MTPSLAIPPAALAVSLLSALVTILAWAWSALMALSFTLNFFSYPMSQPREVEHAQMRRCLLFSVPAWVWLIGRYLIGDIQ